MFFLVKINSNNIVEEKFDIQEADQAIRKPDLVALYNLSGNWKLASDEGYFNKNIYGDPVFRKNTPTIGFLFDESRDAFIWPKRHESWILNEETYDWMPPIPKPEDNNNYYWDESIKNWKIIDS